MKCILTIKDDTKIAPYIDAIRQLKVEGVFDGLPHIGNDMRLLSLIRQFDFEHWDPETGLSEQSLAKLRNQYNVARWTLACGIYGTKEIAWAKAKRARKLLSKIGTVRILTDRMIQKGSLLCHLAKNYFPILLSKQFSENMQLMNELSELLKLLDGYPTDFARKGCYWRNRRVQWQREADPVADGCGFRWIAPTLPLRGHEIARMIEIARHHYQQMGFEFAITLTAVNSKICQAILTIYFDMDNSSEIIRAKQLASTLKKEFDNHGWRAYRIAIDETLDEMSSYNASITDLRLRLKQALDPNGIIAPGRYCPAPSNNAGQEKLRHC